MITKIPNSSSPSTIGGTAIHCEVDDSCNALMKRSGHSEFTEKREKESCSEYEENDDEQDILMIPGYTLPPFKIKTSAHVIPDVVLLQKIKSEHGEEILISKSHRVQTFYNKRDLFPPINNAQQSQDRERLWEAMDCIYSTQKFLKHNGFNESVYVETLTRLLNGNNENMSASSLSFSALTPGTYSKEVTFTLHLGSGNPLGYVRLDIVSVYDGIGIEVKTTQKGVCTEDHILQAVSYLSSIPSMKFIFVVNYPQQLVFK